MIIILYLSLSALSDIQQGRATINRKVLWGTFLLYLVLLFYPFHSGTLVVFPIKFLATLFLILYTLVIHFFSSPKLSPWLKPILLLIVIAELTIMEYPAMNLRVSLSRDEINANIYYKDATVDAVNWIQNIDHGFFRISKDYYSGPSRHTSINDALVQGYNSTSSYNSFNQKNYIEFLSSMGLADLSKESTTKWARGISERPFLLNMAANRYYIQSINNKSFMVEFGYDSLTTIRNKKIYSNKLTTPFGFVCHQKISETDFNKLSIYWRDVALLNTVIIENENLSDFQEIPDMKFRDTSKIFSFKDYGITTR